MQSPLFWSGPLSLADLLDWTIRLYRARFGTLLFTVAIFMTPVWLLITIVVGPTMANNLNILLTAIQMPTVIVEPMVSAEAQGNMAILRFLLTLIEIVINGLVMLVLTAQAIATIKQEEIATLTSIRQGAHRFWTWVGMTFTTYAAYIGIFIACAVFGLVSFYAAITVAVFLVLSVSARWAVAVPLIVDQRMGALAALRESRHLTKGHVRYAIGFVVLTLLFYGILYIAFMALAFAVSQVALTSASSSFANVAIFTIADTLAPLLWMPIAAVGYVVLYYELRVRKQGYDLELRIDALETEVARATNATV